MGPSIHRHGHLKVRLKPHRSLFIAEPFSVECSGSGLVLEAYVNAFEGFGLFAPVVTAISGAAGSIYVSRISTSLHSNQKEHFLIVALSLFALTCPVLFLFLLFVWVTGQAPITVAFAVGFLVVVCIQVGPTLRPIGDELELTRCHAGRSLLDSRISHDFHSVPNGLRPRRLRPPTSVLLPRCFGAAVARWCFRGGREEGGRARCGRGNDRSGDGELAFKQ